MATLGDLAGRMPHARFALTSRSQRTRQTALLLGLFADVVAELDDCDFGCWRGRTLVDVASNHPGEFACWLSDPAGAPHGGESITALIARVASWLDAIASADSVIAITHPAVLRAASLHVLNAPAASFWRIDVAPLAMLDLRHDSRRWAMRAPALV